MQVFHCRKGFIWTLLIVLLVAAIPRDRTAESEPAPASAMPGMPGRSAPSTATAATTACSRRPPSAPTAIRRSIM